MNEDRAQTNGETKPDMSVVLVCWNNKAYLEPCLRSLFDGGLRSSFDVVVVDNGSTDGSQEMLRAVFPQVKLIENGRNVGLGRASNQGIEATAGRYVLLLNNDTIVNGASLDALVEFMDRTPDAAVAGGRLLNGDGSFQAGHCRFSSLAEELLIATGIGNLQFRSNPFQLDSDRIREVDWVGSACCIVRRSALDQVGLLDEEYFIYGDEEDLQYRMKRAGWKVYYLPEVTTIHFGGRSMDRWRRRKMVYRGKMLFFRKNYGSLPTSILRFVFGALSAGKIVVWGIASASPRWRERARLEVRSNVEVMWLCFRLA